MCAPLFICALCCGPFIPHQPPIVFITPYPTFPFIIITFPFSLILPICCCCCTFTFTFICDRWYYIVIQCPLLLLLLSCWWVSFVVPLWPSLLFTYIPFIRWWCPHLLLLLSPIYDCCCCGGYALRLFWSFVYSCIPSRCCGIIVVRYPQIALPYYIPHSLPHICIAPHCIPLSFVVVVVGGGGWFVWELLLHLFYSPFVCYPTFVCTYVVFVPFPLLLLLTPWHSLCPSGPFWYIHPSVVSSTDIPTVGPSFTFPLLHLSPWHSQVSDLREVGGSGWFVPHSWCVAIPIPICPRPLIPPLICRAWQKWWSIVISVFPVVNIIFPFPLCVSILCVCWGVVW